MTWMSTDVLYSSMQTKGNISHSHNLKTHTVQIWPTEMLTFNHSVSLPIVIAFNIELQWAFSVVLIQYWHSNICIHMCISKDYIRIFHISHFWTQTLTKPLPYQTLQVNLTRIEIPRPNYRTKHLSNVLTWCSIAISDILTKQLSASHCYVLLAFIALFVGKPVILLNICYSPLWITLQKHKTGKTSCEGSLMQGWLWSQHLLD